MFVVEYSPVEGDTPLRGKLVRSTSSYVVVEGEDGYQKHIKRKFVTCVHRVDALGLLVS